MLMLLVPRHTEGPKSRPGSLNPGIPDSEGGSFLVGLSCELQDVKQQTWPLPTRFSHPQLCQPKISPDMANHPPRDKIALVLKCGFTLLPGGF